MVSCQTPVTSVGPGLFYQPLHQDRALSPAQWQQLLQQVAAQGYSSLVIQWSQYGAADFSNSASVLPQLLVLAQQHGIKLWLGLYADPVYFQSLPAESAARQRYIRQQLALSQLQWQKLQPLITPYPELIAGWYLPFELNDTDFQQPDYVNWLTDNLRQFQLGLKQPLAISAYGNGSLDSGAFIAALNQLKTSGVTLWLQDGAGAGLINSTQRRALLAALPCDIGVIGERFRPQQTATAGFRPASVSEWQAAQQAVKPCHAKLSFSLRYLPLAQGILALPKI